MDRCLQVQVVVVGAVDLLLFSGLPEFFLSLRFFVKSMLVNLVAPQHCTDCGNFRIFLSLRFYVKPMENSEVVKLPFIGIFGAVDFVNLLNSSFKKVQKFIKIKIQILSMRKNCIF